MKKIIKYVILDILRNRIVMGYTIFLLLISFSVFNLEGNVAKGVLSLLNVILIIVPLVSIIFSAIYIYNSAEFIELLVSQPLKRKSLWLSLFTGLALSLSAAFFVGCGIPILLFAPADTGIIMIVMGIVISVIYTAIALLASMYTRDKAKGIGVVILLWFYFTLIFDGIVLMLLFQFADYPLEKPMIALSCLNPIDMARILILLKLDISALMGATSAVFRDFFGSILGTIVAALTLITWIIFPLWLSAQRFNRKDL